ncbi:MAG: methyl-accepting chemotaxis protein [Acidobacteriota bacterium]|nr:methyl-accepting chemotaxis protein [Acidobacteriota bacterium]
MRLSLKARMAIAFGAVALMGIISASVGYYQLTEIGRMQHVVRSVRIPVAMAAERASRNACAEGLQMRNMLLYGDDPQSLARHDKLRHDAWKQNFDDLAQLKELVPEQESRALVERIEARSRDALQLQEEVLSEAARRQPDSLKHALERLKAAGPMLAASQAECAELNRRVHDALDADSRKLADMQSRATVTGLVLLSILLGVLLLGGFLLGSRIQTFIKTLDQRMRLIATGDLRGRDLPEDGGDEVALIYTDLNSMQNKLKDTIQRVSAGAELVAGASEDLSGSASEIAHTADDQKDQAVQVASAMQQMAAAVERVGDSCTRALDNAQSAGELAKSGGRIVSSTVEMIQGLAESTRDTATKIAALGRSGEQIGVIIGVIDDIADQTNLLALNAAIEAARAGEQGRGFAVVADEVRKLAERTANATKEVAAMIATIQQETKKAVSAMEAGNTKVSAGVDAASQASTALTQIIESSDRMHEMVSSIARAAVEQTESARDVNHSMDEIARMAQQSSAGAQKSAKACQDLSGLGKDLQQAVGSFHTGQEHMSLPVPPRPGTRAMASLVQ